MPKIIQLLFILLSLVLEKSYGQDGIRENLLMSYGEAMNLALHGHIFKGVIDAMKRELFKAEATGNVGYINQIKVNLGVGHMQLASRVFYSNIYVQLYNESEKYFLSVLNSDPTNEFARSNLAVVRKNRGSREGEESEWRQPVLPVEKQGRALTSRASTTQDKHDRCISGSTKDGVLVDRWLTIGIPTVPRRGDPDYLQQTLNAIISQLPLRKDDPLYGKIIVVVLNNMPGHHKIFEIAKAQIQAGPLKDYFIFEEAEILHADGIDNPENHVYIPGARVRYYTRSALQ